jgi:hypothetical protein
MEQVTAPAKGLCISAWRPRLSQEVRPQSLHQASAGSQTDEGAGQGVDRRSATTKDVAQARPTMSPLPGRAAVVSPRPPSRLRPRADIGASVVISCRPQVGGRVVPLLPKALTNESPGAPTAPSSPAIPFARGHVEEPFQ